MAFQCLVFQCLVLPAPVMAKATVKVDHKGLSDDSHTKALAIALKKKAVAAYQNMENAPYLTGLLTDYIAIEPNDFEGYLYRGLVEFDSAATTPEGSTDLQKAISLNPSCTQALAEIIWNWAPSSQHELLRAKARNLLKNPHSFWDFRYLARVEDSYAYSSDTEKEALAIRGLREAKKLVNYNSARELYELSRLYYENFDHQQALYYANRALRLNPKSVTLLTANAELLRFTHQFKESIAVSNQLIELSPQCGGFYQRAITKDFMHDFKGATADYETDRKLNERIWNLHPQRYNELAQVQEKCGNFTGALEDYNICLALEPRNYEALQHRAELLEKQGKFKEAILDYNRLIAYSKTSRLLACRFYCHFRSGAPLDAWKDFQLLLGIPS